MSALSAFVSVLLVVALGACGDDGAPPEDAGPGDGGGDASIVVEPPAPPTDPAPPARGCPAGFTATSDGVCDPWPDGPLDCEPHEIQVPGSATCERLGPACPAASEWATDLPSSGTIRFVRAGAAAGGDGSRDAPFSTIGEAASLAGAGDVIAVTAGTYDEAVSLRGGVTLHGACAESTVIAPSFGAVSTLTATGEGVVVKNLTLSGGGSGVALDRSTGARLENVLVLDNDDFAIRVLFGAALEADGLIVRGTRPATARGSFGRGLDVEGGSTATIDRALFEDNTDFSIFVAVDSELTLDRVTVRGTRPQESDGAHGRALNAIDGATATVTRSIFEDSAEIAVFFTGEGTTASLEDVVIRRTVPGEQRAGAETGTAFSVEQGAVVRARGLLIEQSASAGILVISNGDLTAEDVVVDRVASDGIGDLGLAVAVERASVLALSRAVLRDSRTVGVGVKGEGTRAVLEDVLVSGVDVRENDGELGMGIGVVDGAEAELRRVGVEDTALYGLFADAPGTAVMLEDVSVRRTGTRGGRGFGLLVRDAAAVTGARLSLTQMAEMGILAGLNGASVDLDDVEISEVTQRFVEEEGVHYGAGIQLEEGGALTIERVAIDEAAHHAVFSFGGIMELTDLRISSPTEDDSGQLGYGLTANDDAMVTLVDTITEGVFGAGISAFGTGRIVARGLEVRETQSNSARGTLGWGVAAVSGGYLELENARFYDNREASIMSQDEGSRVVARDIVIENTLPNACSEAGTCEGGAGFGASADGGAIELTDFVIRGNALGGVQILDGGSADLSRGVIANNPVGVNVQDDPSYDFQRLTDEVRFIDNDRNIDSTIVPLPDTSLENAGLPETPTEAPDF